MQKKKHRGLADALLSPCDGVCHLSPQTLCRHTECIASDENVSDEKHFVARGLPVARVFTASGARILDQPLCSFLGHHQCGAVGVAAGDVDRTLGA